MTPYDDKEARQISEFLDWILSGAELFRVQKSTLPSKHLISYFVVVDGDHLLLVDHKNSGLWLPPGGYVYPGEHPRNTVVREALEELGMAAEFERVGPAMLTVVETIDHTTSASGTPLPLTDGRLSITTAREFNGE